MKKILYFVRGNPTKSQAKEIETLGAKVRNADAWTKEDFMEKCDAVAGDVPEGYAHLPRADRQTTRIKAEQIPEDVA